MSKAKGAFGVLIAGAFGVLNGIAVFDPAFKEQQKLKEAGGEFAVKHGGVEGSSAGADVDVEGKELKIEGQETGKGDGRNTSSEATKP